MSYDGWMRFGDTEVINISRTASLAAVLGITSVWQRPEQVAWIKNRFAGASANYGDVTTTPWYDPGFPASSEFAGLVPVDVGGLDDSTAAAETFEYIGDGGSTRALRSATLPVVFSAAIVASTERGADFGKRWLDRLLRSGGKMGKPSSIRRRTNLTTGVNNSLHQFWSDASTTGSLLADGTIRATKGGSTAGTFNMGWGLSTPATTAKAEATQTVTLSADITPSAAGNVRAMIRFYNAANGTIATSSGPVVASAAGATTRLTHTATAPAGTARVAYYFSAPSTPVGGTMDMKNVLLEIAVGDLGYFDGDTQGTFRDQYGWVGAPRASESYRMDEPTPKAKTLQYLRYGAQASPMVHRRDVSLTRGSSVTRKRSRVGSVTWSVTWTLTADDSYEYGEEVYRIANLGAATATGPGVTSQGSLTMVQASCPVYDYSPVHDPLYPALVPAPAPPDFLPDGWNITPGRNYKRSWARIAAIEPSDMFSVPVIKVTSQVDARMVRVSVWPSVSPNDDQCDPLFSLVLTYLPGGTPVYIDGEQQAAYAWDGASPVVRRIDSLLYGEDAMPLRWSAFTDPVELLVTLDAFETTTAGQYEGAGTLLAAVSLVPKSD